MKGIRTYLFLAAVLLSRPGLADPGYVEGEVLVKYRRELSTAALRRAAAGHGMVVRRRFKGLSGRRKRAYCHLKSKNRTTRQLIAVLEKDPDVEYVCPNYLMPVCGPAHPNDTNFSLLWGLHNVGQEVNGTSGTADADIDAPEAWAAGRRDAGEVVVAVIDTGVEYDHPDLRDAMWVNPGEIPGNGTDDDGNGYTNDVHGYDFSGDQGNGPDADPRDMSRHGTHLAGIIAAVANNTTGVTGTANVKVMALKASTNGVNIVASAAIEAIEYATMMRTQGVPIVAINMSYGSYDENSLERDAIADAGDAGIVVVASAGNDDTNNDTKPHYPSSYGYEDGLSNMLAVAASGSSDGKATFSNHGQNSVDMVAPGINILSTIPLHYKTHASVESPPDTYTAVRIKFAGVTTGIVGTAYDCGIGQPAQFPAGVSGNVAVIERGTLNFNEKVANAEDAGATAVIIYNNEIAPTQGIWSLQYPGDWLPAVEITRTDGLALLDKGETTVTVVNSPVGYSYAQGSSMAAAYVSGATAFIAQQYPDDTVVERQQRIWTSTDFIPGLSIYVATSGRLNMRRGVDIDGDTLGDWWELAHFGNMFMANATTDRDDDGFLDGAEFIAGTDPQAPTSLLEVTAMDIGTTNGFEIRWASRSNRLYSVYSATNLSSNFTVLAGDIPATPPENVLVDTSTVGRARSFYRITTMLPSGPP